MDRSNQRRNSHRRCKPQFRGRPASKPYTVIGMRRKRCHCGAQAVHQWQACANGRRCVPVCLECDYKINEFALLTMFGDTKWTRQTLAAYRVKLGL